MAATQHSDIFNSKSSVEENQSDSDFWDLLDDHPRRSYPAGFIPHVSSDVARVLAVVRRRCTERIFPLACLCLMFLIVAQFLAALPYGFMYIFLRRGIDGQQVVFPWPAEFRGETSTCILHNLRTRDAVQHAVDAGCSGVKVDIQSSGDELLVESPIPDQEASSTLHSLYLSTLVGKLDAINSAAVSPVSTDGSDPIGLFDGNPGQSFMLFLELHTSLKIAWPQLVSQLTPLKQKGYLSYRNETRVVPRPVTIVLTGFDASELDEDDSMRENIMFDTPLEQLAVDDGDSALTISAPAPGPRSDPADLPYPVFTATANFSRSIGFPHRGGRFSPRQIERVRAQVRAAHRRGFRARYEGIPSYPPPVRRMIWRILDHAGADFIEIDGTGCEIPWWRRILLIGMECQRSEKGR
ncbi:hypothetical protein BDV28DRAFT_157682 [Aspergillus coremiiformis]|uniref:PLC-like phosphodiesterase n=1 Tax=Aspergillus coremiiformis TaxID=138285 RepID=A0A5N6Z9F4_9EURO|nr:hypothetical protein BDV28DRAFT_157682 [Aspergillus coremiiformis]